MRKGGGNVVHQQITDIFVCSHIFHIPATNNRDSVTISSELTDLSYSCLKSSFPKAVISGE